MKKEEFMRHIEECHLPLSFDQHLLDSAAEMFSKWGLTTHMDEREHLFERSGLASRPEDSDPARKEKEALRCVCRRMMDLKLSRKDASVIIKNFNKIKDPGFKWNETQNVLMQL